MKDLKEKWLLYRLKTKKDPEAFTELYDRYAARIYRFVYFKVSEQTEAEDITAEVFLKTWQYVNEHKEIENFSALIYQIARNLVIDFYRRRSGRPEEELDDTLLEKLVQVKDAAEEASLKAEAGAVITALRRLKNEYREVLIMRYVDELDIDEIAKILNKSQVGTRVLIHRSLKVLRTILEQAPI